MLFYLKKDISRISHDTIFLKKNNQGFITFKNLIISTIPIVFVGFLIHLYDFNIIRNLEIIGWSTLGFGILLGIADTNIKIKKFIKNLNLKDAFIIGLFQVLALIPGTSRSGIVITAGLFMGFSRYDASKYSFLLSIPVILAAMTLESFSLYRMEGFFFNDEMIIGIISSFCLAFLTIKLFMKWINTASLKIFVFYRIVPVSYTHLTLPTKRIV